MARPQTLDFFYGGRVRLRQFATGHRVGHDAALLAASCPMTPGEIIDAGAGSGAAGVAAAIDRPEARLTLLDVEPDLIALAAENLVLNAMEGRGRALACDLLSPASRRAAGLQPEQAQVVLTNPPFHLPGAVRQTPDALKARAHVLAGGPGALENWLRACLALLAPGGDLRVIHRPEALPALLRGLEGRAGDVRIVPVHPRPAAPAARLLLFARKGSRAPLRIEPALSLCGCDGAPDAAAQEILQGRARLTLPS